MKSITRQTKKQTLVLKLQELYALIPETKSLGRKEYTNTMDLLKEVIDTIEESGRWEFVQYVKGEPSVFIIRDTMINVKFKSEDKPVVSQRDSVKDQIKKDMNMSKVKTLPDITETHVPIITKLPWET